MILPPAAAASAAAGLLLSGDDDALLLLLVPPCLALGYSVAVQIFLAFPRECSWTAHSGHIALRAAWAGAAAAIRGNLVGRGVGSGGGGGDEDDPAAATSAALTVVFILSAYLVYLTRADQIQGPPPFPRRRRRVGFGFGFGVGTPPPPATPMMRGRVVLVTGANSGIGKETARQLFEAGATVVMGCRSEVRCREAMEDILGRRRRSSSSGSAVSSSPSSSSSSKSSSSRATSTSSPSPGGGKGPGVVKKRGEDSGASDGPREKEEEEEENAEDDPRSRLIHLPLDLSSLSSVRSAASLYRSWNLPLHVLINNAGLMTARRTTSVDGHELTMACNHLGHFLLTLELLPLLRKVAAAAGEDENGGDGGGDARVVTVSSSTYALSSAERGGMILDDLDCERRDYGMFAQYSQSKLANVLFGRELARRETERFNSAAATAAAAPVASHILHPGLVRTDVVRNMPWYLYYPNGAFGVILASLQKTPSAGAYTSVYCASSPELIGRSGGYYVNSREERPEECALDEAAGRRLWEISEKITGG